MQSCVCAESFQSCLTLWLSVTLWTVAHQAPLSMGFSRQEYWSGLPFSSPWHLLGGQNFFLLFFWERHMNKLTKRICRSYFEHWRGLWRAKITADGDCSHEIKRRLLLGRKVTINLDSIFKSRDITLPTKFQLVKAMVFSVVMYGCESWTVKAECQRIDVFELWC